MKKTANRCGMDFHLKDYSTGAPVMTFPFINDLKTTARVLP